MKLKRLQLSLGSLFLAMLMFGVGLVVGLRFNLNRAEDRREIGKLEKQIEGHKLQNLILQEKERNRQLSDTFKREDELRQRKVVDALIQRIQELGKRP